MVSLIGFLHGSVALNIICVSNPSSCIGHITFQVGLPFSDNKIIPRNMEQVGTDGSSVGIPPVSRKRKTSEFRSEPFL